MKATKPTPCLRLKAGVTRLERGAVRLYRRGGPVRPKPLHARAVKLGGLGAADLGSEKDRQTPADGRRRRDAQPRVGAENNVGLVRLPGGEEE